MLVGPPASGKSKGGAPRKPWEQLSARAKRDRRQEEARDANGPVAVAVTDVPADEHGAAGTNAAHEVFRIGRPRRADEDVEERSLYRREYRDRVNQETARLRLLLPDGHAAPSGGLRSLALVAAERVKAERAETERAQTELAKAERAETDSRAAGAGWNSLDV